MAKGDKDDPIYIRASIGDPQVNREFDQTTFWTLAVIFVFVCVCGVISWFK